MVDYSKFAPSTSLRSRQKAATRQLLIDAAAQVFSLHSYAKTRIDYVAAAAGTSRATFYLHFSSKDELLIELIARAEAGFSADFDKLAQLFRDPKVDELHEWILCALTRWNTASALMRPVFEATDHDPALASKLLPQVLPGSEPLAAALLEAKVCNMPERAQTMALVLMAPLFLAFRRRASGTATDEPELARLTAISWAALAAQPSCERR